jgi:hypothetical protein
MTMPELAHVELFAAGIEPENAASAGALRKAGFQPLDPEPDWEGIVYYALDLTRVILGPPSYQADQWVPRSPE